MSELVRAGKIRSYGGAMSYMENRGITGRFRDLLKLAEETGEKIRKNLPRNGGIHAYESGEKAVFLNGEKKVLTDDEFEYLKPVVPVWERKNEY